MKPIFAALALSLVSAGSALAALPPYYDSGRQLDVILSSGEVADAVRIAPIEGLDRLEESAGGAIQWRVRTRDCAVTVEIKAIPLPQGMVGAVNYEVVRVSPCEPAAE